MDGDSIGNLVSKGKKIGYRRLKHPCPYGMIWFQDDHMTEVNE